MEVWKHEGMVVPVKSWCPDAEQGAVDQINEAARLPFVFHHLAMMPDAHAGYGVPIGSVVATRGVILPYFVGVDIGCGMLAMKTSLTEIDTPDLKTLMGKIRLAVPVGFNHHKTDRMWEGFDRAPKTAIVQQELNASRKQLGTLGGGNHFIEIQKGDDDHVWVMIHSGSRNFGLKIAKAYHEEAQALCAKWHSAIPSKDLAFLPTDSVAGMAYWDAMNFALEFAQENRRQMLGEICAIMADSLGATFFMPINIHHNYATIEHHFGQNVVVHRKGATRAFAGQDGIIPGSMGTPSYITEGLGNPESFMSSSHGAGRRMGRKEAIRSLNLETEQAAMSGVVHGLRNQADLDEAPGAYKDVVAVMENQKDLVKIVVSLMPLASIKG